VAGAGFLHAHERVAGVVQSGESFYRLTVGMMVVLLGVGLPARGIMTMHFVLVAGGLSG
jgi:hypothetical protein